LKWEDCPHGTGSLVNELKNNNLDVIVALTEGLVSEITQGSNIRIFSTYVASPLRWAVITGKDSKFTSVEQLKGQAFGISRFTSGSHLMVSVLADQNHWDPQKDVSYQVKGNFQNLRNGVNDLSTAAFLWEYFTTKPYQDKGEVRIIGELFSPWPCFMMAATPQYLKTNADLVKRLVQSIAEACKLFHSTPNIDQIIAQKYELSHEDAKGWLSKVKITGDGVVDKQAIATAVEVLYKAKVLNSKEFDISNYIDMQIAKLEDSTGTQSV